MDLTRRELVAGSATLLAATAAAPLWAQAPARKLRYAVVGLGGYATRQIMPQFKNCEHSELVGLVSGTPEKLERYGAEYNIPVANRYSYANYDSIRSNPNIDAVYIILPNSMHAEYSIRASKAGKHVMCEKPMAVSSAEARAMIAAARSAKRLLTIGYRSRFQPHNVKAIELARGAAVGPTRIVTAEHGFYAQPGQWRLDRKFSGGGSLMDMGIYNVNAVRYLTGEEPLAVSAMESTDRTDPRFRTVEDRIDFQFRFPSGTLANCVSSYNSAHNQYRVIGTKGWIDAEPATNYEGQVLRMKGPDGPITQVEVSTAGKNQFAGLLDHLAECVMTGRTPIIGGEEGLRDMLLIEAIYRSAREGRTVTPERV